jgi:exopolysaccharide production protein ExoQ
MVPALGRPRRWQQVAAPRRRAGARSASAMRDAFQPMNVFVVIVLFWMSGPVAPLIPNIDETFTALFAAHSSSLSEPVDVGGDFLRLSWIPIYLIVLVIACRHGRRIATLVAANGVLVVLLCWVIFSTLWSVGAADTLRRSIALSLSTMFGICLCARYDVLSTVRLLAAALAMDIVASAVCSLVFPGVGIAQSGDYAGAWRGVFASKNTLGAMMLVALLAFYVLYLADRARWHLLAIGAALSLLLLSTSMTPLVTLFALVPALTLTRRLIQRRRRIGLIFGFLASVTALLVLIASTDIEALLAFFGRDATLTGRTEIWQLSWEAILGRFWIGYGYGAFWSNQWGPATEIWDSLNWRVPSSHSGLLELWLGLGIVGVLLFVALVVRTFLTIVANSRRATPEQLIWLVGYFLIFLVHAVTEPTALEQTNISWVLFVSISCARARVTLRSSSASTRRISALRPHVPRLRAVSPFVPSRRFVP